MRTLFLATAAVLIPISAANAGVTVIGDSLAASCFKAAEAKSTTPAAVRDCDTALSGPLTDYDRMATHVNRGVLRMLQRQFVAADADFRTAITLDAREPEAWLNTGILRIHQGRSQEALPPLDRSLELRTERAEIAYFARGLANEDAGRVREAYADLRRAQALAPRWQDVATELARYQVRTR